MQIQGIIAKAAIIITFVVANGAFVYGQSRWTFPDFSATQVFESHRSSMQMKVYQSGDSVRVERSAALSTLYTSKAKIYNFTTYPDHSNHCVVMKPEQAKMLPSPLELLQGLELKREDAGTEVVEGHPCKVENVTIKRPDGKTIESKVWQAQDLQGIPVKIESHIDDITLAAVYRDVRVARPDQALFTIPEKCTPFEKMWQVAEQKRIE
jgi:hypothetical protein